jgi:hypothetical protein
MTATIEVQTAEPKLTDTNKIITHRGQEFKVFTSDQTHPNGPLAPYVIESKRGKRYLLTRNVPKPHMLFGICYTNTKVLPGWFSDQSGELVSLG